VSGLIALGIDLGTTYSVAATMVSGGFRQAWYPKVLSNSAGKDLTPSAVYFDVDKGEVVVGDDALLLWQEHPSNVIRWVKRNMGRAYEYNVVNALHSEIFSPQQISGTILKHVYDCALNRAPEMTKDIIVVTVPAFFGDNERQATLDAAKLIGLRVVLIEEPTAAILDYLHEKVNEGSISPTDGDKYYAVFDLGGGTFDISVALLTWDDNTPIIRIIATEGHNRLGGFDFDLDLTEIALNKFYMKYPLHEKILLRLRESLHEFKTVGKVTDSEVWQLLIQLIDSVESAKRLLGSINSRRIYMPPSRLIGNSIFSELTKEDIKTVLLPKLQDIEKRVGSALISARDNSSSYLDSWDKLDGVILVGGSTRIPLVRDLVSTLFGKAPRLDSHEDQTVARGAAIYAGILAGFDIKGKFQRKTAHSYGILSNSGFQVVIPRGTPYPPAVATVQFPIPFVLSPRIGFNIGQTTGSAFTNEDEGYNLVKEIAYYHPVLYTGDELSITLSIDVNGLLQVNALDNTGEQVEEKIQSIALSEKEAIQQSAQLNEWLRK
jgi:molecular chaperone DnaK